MFVGVGDACRQKAGCGEGPERVFEKVVPAERRKCHWSGDRVRCREARAGGTRPRADTKKPPAGGLRIALESRRQRDAQRPTTAGEKYATMSGIVNVGWGWDRTSREANTRNKDVFSSSVNSDGGRHSRAVRSFVGRELARAQERPGAGQPTLIESRHRNQDSRILAPALFKVLRATIDRDEPRGSHPIDKIPMGLAGSSRSASKLAAYKNIEQRDYSSV
jgi:hypothetical protein